MLAVRQPNLFVCNTTTWYGESTDTSNTFYFHEEYTCERDEKEGVDAHAASPHFQKWEEFSAQNPFTKEPVVSFFKIIAVLIE